MVYARALRALGCITHAGSSPVLGTTMDAESSKNILLSIPNSSEIGKIKIDQTPDGPYVHLEETEQVLAKERELRQKYHETGTIPGNVELSVVTGFSLYNTGSLRLYYVNGTTGLGKEELANIDASTISPGTLIALRMETGTVAKVREIISLHPYDFARQLSSVGVSDFDPLTDPELDPGIWNGNFREIQSTKRNLILTAEEVQNFEGLTKVRIINFNIEFKNLPETFETVINEGDKMVFRLKDPEAGFDNENIEEIFLVNKTLVSR